MCGQHGSPEPAQGSRLDLAGPGFRRKRVIGVGNLETFEASALESVAPRAIRLRIFEKLLGRQVDALTGDVKTATSLKMQITRRVSRDALFDIGADTVGLLVPGGSIAVRIGVTRLSPGRKKILQ